MSELTILIGIPGSGKTRWITSKYKEFFPYIVCPDNIRKTHFGDITDQSKNKAVWDVAKGQVIAALECGKDVILDATNVSTSYRRTFIKTFLPYYKVNAVLFEADPTLCCARIAKDIEEGKDRSNVPDTVIYRMYGELLYTKKVINEEGFSKIEMA